MSHDDIAATLAAPTVSVPVIAKVLGISRNAAYRGVLAGDIESIKVGRTKRVPTAPYRRKLGLDEATPASREAA